MSAGHVERMLKQFRTAIKKADNRDKTSAIEPEWPADGTFNDTPPSDKTLKSRDNQSDVTILSSDVIPVPDHGTSQDSNPQTVFIEEPRER